MQEIKVDSKEVRKAARELRSSMSLIKNKIGTFQDIENEIEASWKSRYTSQYLACLEQTERQVRNAVARIEDVAGNLDKIAASVDKAEREIKMIMAQRNGGGGSW